MSMTRGENVEVTKKKVETTEIFQDATFNLHKWHSNVAKLEDVPQNDQRDNTGRSTGYNLRKRTVWYTRTGIEDTGFVLE